MKKQNKEKSAIFFALGLIFVLGLGLFFILKPDPFTSKIIAYTVAIGYLCWSIFYHQQKGDLTVSNFVEYLTFTLLAIILFSIF